MPRTGQPKQEWTRRNYLDQVVKPMYAARNPHYNMIPGDASDRVALCIGAQVHVPEGRDGKEMMNFAFKMMNLVFKNGEFCR